LFAETYACSDTGRQSQIRPVPDAKAPMLRRL